MKKCIIFGLAIIPSIIFSGCTGSSLDIQQVRQLEQDRQLTCESTAPDRCAILSRFQELADEAAVSDPALHYVSLFDTGEDELLARIHMIRTARESIVMQTYIYDDDQVGLMLYHELLTAARRGVKVRMILDQPGTYMTSDKVASMAMGHENLQIKFFSPLMNRGGKSTTREIGTLILDFETLNERMHNKLFAVDRRMAIVGGRNIKNSYFGHGEEINFKDLGMLAIGPVVEKIYESFDIFWNHEKCVNVLELPDIAAAALERETTGRSVRVDYTAASQFAWLNEAANAYSIFDVRPRLTAYPVKRIEYTADWPVKNLDTPEASQWDSTERIKEIVLSARQSIIMQTPYLIHEFQGILDFGDSWRQHNVDIALSTNSLASSDMLSIYAVTFKQRWHYLEELNSRLYEFKPLPGDVLQMMPNRNGTEIPQQYEGPELCLHAKFFVVDNHISFVGSHNFDPRANNLNTENGLIVWDDAVAKKLHQIFDRDTAPRNSWVAAHDPKLPVAGDISDKIASFSNSLPAFDLWPFYYSNNYNLKEDKTPLPPQHPDFYDHYINVGAFPEAEFIEQFTVRLFLAFGGIAQGLM